MGSDTGQRQPRQPDEPAQGLLKLDSGQLSAEAAVRANQACLNEVRDELFGPGSALPTVRLVRFR
jgi:hypothetical protein